MKSNKFIAFCLSTLLLAGSTGAAFAQGGEGAAEGDPRMQDPLALYRMAGINAEQEEQIRKLAKDFEDSQRVRVKSVIVLYKELKVLQLQPDPNETAVIAKQEEVNKVSSEMATERVRLLLKVRKVLTPDQRKKLVSLLSEEGQPAGGAPAQPAVDGGN